MKRLYIIEAKHYSQTKYHNSEPTEVQHIYQWNERHLFFEKYDYLLKKDMYFDDIKCYYCNYGNNDITEKMNDLKNNI